MKRPKPVTPKPREIVYLRNKIYAYAAEPNDLVEFSRFRSRRTQTVRQKILRTTYVRTLRPAFFALTQVCRQIRQEYRVLYFEKTQQHVYIDEYEAYLLAFYPRRRGCLGLLDTIHGGEVRIRFPGSWNWWERVHYPTSKQLNLPWDKNGELADRKCDSDAHAQSTTIDLLPLLKFHAARPAIRIRFITVPDNSAKDEEQCHVGDWTQEPLGQLHIFDTLFLQPGDRRAPRFVKEEVPLGEILSIAVHCETGLMYRETQRRVHGDQGPRCYRMVAREVCRSKRLMSLPSPGAPGDQANEKKVREVCQQKLRR
ncbi:hypothetical protein M011DRAFT_528003 [Sporormia fimetaria CBS 119925]|uniref:Uncharacterized protein n=1 Tax=Sporormia fimetaria CBS 119925 TaxID=1340428 RepID=A0A6A6V6L2_9PLEO|nr:hypothetical protein M011DRAFT_528003 [Sporormia fimetaria CBS 119925]